MIKMCSQCPSRDVVSSNDESGNRETLRTCSSMEREVLEEMMTLEERAKQISHKSQTRIGPFHAISTRQILMIASNL